RSEVCSVAALEAMAVGLPVVTCENGGVSELVDEGVSGTVVPGASDGAVAQGLANALVALAQDPARRASYGEAGARRARSLFSPTVMARATAAAYRGVAPRPD